MVYLTGNAFAAACMFACLYVGRRTFAIEYMWGRRPQETDAKTMDIVAELWSVGKTLKSNLSYLWCIDLFV